MGEEAITAKAQELLADLEQAKQQVVHQALEDLNSSEGLKVVRKMQRIHEEADNSDLQLIIAAEEMADGTERLWNFTVFFPQRNQFFDLYDPPLEELSDQENTTIEDLISLLGDGTYAGRVAAAAELAKRGGRELLLKLADAMDHEDLEIAWRSESIISKLATGDDGKLGARGTEGKPRSERLMLYASQIYDTDRYADNQHLVVKRLEEIETIRALHQAGALVNRPLDNCHLSFMRQQEIDLHDPSYESARLRIKYALDLARGEEGAGSGTPEEKALATHVLTEACSRYPQVVHQKLFLEAASYSGAYDNQDFMREFRQSDGDERRLELTASRQLTAFALRLANGKEGNGNGSPEEKELARQVLTSTIVRFPQVVNHSLFLRAACYSAAIDDQNFLELYQRSNGDMERLEAIAANIDDKN